MAAFKLLLEQPSPQWITARGCSMQPTWNDGARLLIQAIRSEQLRGGDLILYDDGGELIVHRLLALRKAAQGLEFRAKADAACTPEAWRSVELVLGRIIRIEQDQRVRHLRTRRARWLQRCIGWRERVHVGAHAVLRAWTQRLARSRPWAEALALRPALSAAPEADAVTRRQRWAQNQLKLNQLKACLPTLESLNVRPIVLKGMALIAQKIADPEQRKFADLDILIPSHERVRVVSALLKVGWSYAGAHEPVQSHLRDKVVLRTPEGAWVDLHWTLVNGGWRMRGLFPIDEPGLWARSHAVVYEGLRVRVLAQEDQLLHLCMHLVISGCTGIKWWQDLCAIFEHSDVALDWHKVTERAVAWRVRHIVWIVMDVLTRRSRVCVHVPTLRRMRPVFWKRLLLRGLVPKDLSGEKSQASFWRYLRDSLLAERLADSLCLWLRWSRPPKLWHVLRDL